MTTTGENNATRTMHAHAYYYCIYKAFLMCLVCTHCILCRSLSHLLLARLTVGHFDVVIGPVLVAHLLLGHHLVRELGEHLVNALEVRLDRREHFPHGTLHQYAIDVPTRSDADTYTERVEVVHRHNHEGMIHITELKHRHALLQTEIDHLCDVN
jgi:hypothetical protein